MQYYMSRYGGHGMTFGAVKSGNIFNFKLPKQQYKLFCKIVLIVIGDLGFKTILIYL